jgi:hypothetical protein
MAHPVSAILSHQDELARRARRFTGDVNEAGLIVGKVMSRAFKKFRQEASEDAIADQMKRDLDEIIQKLKRKLS